MCMTPSGAWIFIMAWMAPSGGQGAGGHLRYVVLACMAVATGLCRHVLVYRSVSMFSGEFKGGAVGAGEWQLPFHSYSAANAVALHLRGQELSLRDIAARLVIATGKKKGQHPSPATVMRMLREHDEKTAAASVVA